MQHCQSFSLVSLFNCNIIFKSTIYTIYAESAFTPISQSINLVCSYVCKTVNINVEYVLQFIACKMYVHSFSQKITRHPALCQLSSIGSRPSSSHEASLTDATAWIFVTFVRWPRSFDLCHQNLFVLLLLSLTWRVFISGVWFRSL